MDRLIFFSFARRPRRFRSAKLSGAVVLLAGSSFAVAMPEALAAGAPTTLQALAKPTITKDNSGVSCNAYETSGSGAHLVVTGGAKGGITYPNGFRMTATGNCTERTMGYTWKLPAKYKAVRADVGFDLSNATTCDTDIVRLLGDNGQILPFTAGGKTVEGTYIPKTGVRAAAVGLSGQSSLTIQITWVPGTCNSGNAAIDIVNDHLS